MVSATEPACTAEGVFGEPTKRGRVSSIFDDQKKLLQCLLSANSPSPHQLRLMEAYKTPSQAGLTTGGAPSSQQHQQVSQV